MADLFTYKKLPSDPCLSEEQMLSYLDGKLSTAEQHACEKHMADCAMCEDAMEGLALVKDRSVLALPLKENKGSKQEAKVVPLNPQPNRFRIVYAAAAVLVLVLGSVFILKNLGTSDEAQSLAENNMKADSITSPDGSIASERNDSVAGGQDAIAEGQQLQTIDGLKNVPRASENSLGPGYAYEAPMDDAPVLNAESIELDEADFMVPQPDEYRAPEAAKDADKNDGDVASEEEVVQQEKVAETESKEKKEGFLDRTKIALPKSNSDQKTTLSDNQRSEDVNKPNTSPAPQNASGGVSGNEQVVFTNSGAASDSTVVFDANNTNSLEQSYQAGVDLYNAGQANQAITMFDKVLVDKKHPRYEDAELMKAKALIKANRKPEAKTLLQSIEAKKGKHAAEATDLLKTI